MHIEREEMNIIGVDLGSNKAAVTRIHGFRADEPEFNVQLITSTEKDRDTRIVIITKEIWREIITNDPDLVVIEYPFGIQGNGRILVEMFGMLRYLITNHIMIGSSMQFLELSQTRIKKYVTGSGKAEKSDMRMEVMKEYGLDLSEDCADSFWIAHMGMSYLYGADKAYRRESIEAWKKSMLPKPKKTKKKG
jgi:Holliday junction resolvasome RuvABC endonuclease subunit